MSEICVHKLLVVFEQRNATFYLTDIISCSAFLLLVLQASRQNCMAVEVLAPPSQCVQLIIPHLDASRGPLRLLRHAHVFLFAAHLLFRQRVFEMVLLLLAVFGERGPTDDFVAISFEIVGFPGDLQLERLRGL